ncbi:IS30 family transposase [Patescibacteria group bacterium]|nr:IS30 family transposase [Patescibacteria group bacterium]
MLYHHLTQEDRVRLAALKRAGHTHSFIAQQLGLHYTTIGRELKRNGAGRYHATTAKLLTIARRRRANQCCRKLTYNKKLQRQIERKLVNRHWSPEQIAAWSGSVSHMTIYRWIYEERSDLKKCLRSRKGKWRRKHGTATREAWRERQKKRWIDTRPTIVDKRGRFGDWEGDTVVGTDRKSAILTHVERKSGYVFLDKLERSTAQAVRHAVRKKFSKLPQSKRRTITYDNGSEFSAHELIERETKTTVYFAHPYSSWERGCNENLNGLLRQYFPKKTSLKDVTQAQLDRAAWLLNTRPRKRLNWLTPVQVLNEKAVHLRC